MANDDPQAGVNERLGTPEAEAPEHAAPAATAGAASTTPAPTDVASTPAAPVAPTVPTAGLPDGVVAIDSTVLADLQRNARLGADARAEQDRTRRDGIIATALSEGRITTASKDHFRKMLDSDEATATITIASLAKNAVPVEELGHASAAVVDDAYPAHWKR